MIRISKPAATEFNPYYEKYITLVGEDALAALRAGGAATPRLLSGVSESQAMFRYAPGKWSVKEVLGHIMDCERVFLYRALWIGRGDKTPMPGFEETDWVPAGRFDRRTLPELLTEYVAVRAATVALLSTFEEEDLVRMGTANDSPVSVRALVHIIAGHELHHVGLLRERYGLS